MNDATDELKASAIYKELLAQMRQAASARCDEASIEIAAPVSFVLVVNSKKTLSRVTNLHKARVAEEMAKAAKLKAFRALKASLEKEPLS